MNEEQQIEMRLWEYIDGTATIEEKKEMEELLRNNVQWQKLYEELLQMQTFMRKSIELDEPSLRFTKNVMDEIAKTKIAPATKNYINKKIINIIAGIFIAMIAGLLIFSFTQITWQTESDNSFMNKLNVSNYLNKDTLNIILMVNVILGLILLDRILFRKKMQSKREVH